MKWMFATLSLLAIGFFASVTTAGQQDSKDLPTPTLVNHLTMNQWVRSTENGELTGRVFMPGVGGAADALKDVTVAMKSRDGEVLLAKTDDKGMFKVAGVSSGVYALTARGADVFACCAMHVIDHGVSSDVELPTQADIAVANVDYTIVNTAVIRYMPTQVRGADASLVGAKLGELKDLVCTQDSFRVVQTGGGMKGRIHLAGAKDSSLSDAQATNVFLFKGGMEIDRALTNDSGAFTFANIVPGNYSVMAIGPDGIGLIGFELVDQSSQVSQSEISNDDTQLVGFGLFGRRHHKKQCAEEFAIQVAPCPEVVTCVQEVVIQEVPMIETIVDQGCGCAVPCEVMEGQGAFGQFGGGYGGGGGGYGGGGGGGFGGGLGGIGALAGLAAIPAIIAVTSDDDNNAIIAPVITSPAVPVVPAN